MTRPVIKVLNKHHGHQPDGQRKIYIGRGSPLGNPYRRGIYGNKEQCIAAYRHWLQQCIDNNHHDVCEALNTIAAYAATGGVDLICFCAPKGCHGDVIKEIVLTALGENNGD